MTDKPLTEEFTRLRAAMTAELTRFDELCTTLVHQADALHETFLEARRSALRLRGHLAAAAIEQDYRAETGHALARP